jgi:hypothetical protein
MNTSSTEQNKTNKQQKKKLCYLGLVVHTYNPKAREAKAGGLMKVRGQPGLYNETLSH